MSGFPKSSSRDRGFLSAMRWRAARICRSFSKTTSGLTMRRIPSATTSRRIRRCPNGGKMLQGRFVQPFFVREPIHVLNHGPGFERCGSLVIGLIEEPAMLKNLMLEDRDGFVKDHHVGLAA